TAVGTFLVFSIVSFRAGWIGQSDCGCFGVPASPWYAFGLDVTVLLLLAIGRPGLRALRVRPYEVCSRTLVVGGRFAVGFAAVSALLYGVAVTAFGSAEAALAHLRGELLTIYPSLLDLGTGMPGGALVTTAVVTNWADEPIRL